MRSTLALTAAVLPVLAIVGCGGGGPIEQVGGQTASTTANATELTSRVSFHANAGTEHERILNSGGLVIRASCIDYGQGRKYLSVGARTRINNAARALVLSQRRAGSAQTYAFKSSDFDRSYGWYDFTGTDPYDTTGTLSYARPDGGQVALTFKADEGTPQGDCTLDGVARYSP